MTTGFSTYSDLILRIQEQTEDDSAEFLAAIPNFIRAAELRLSKEIDTTYLKQNVSQTASVGNRYILKPSGFRFMHDVFIYDSDTEEETRLDCRADDYLRDFWPKASTTSKPRYYAQDYDNTYILLAPTPDKTYEVRMNAEADLTQLSTSNESNYLSVNCGEILYYAAMVHAAIFNKNDNEKARFEDLYTRGIETLNNQGRRARRDDGIPPMNPSGGQNTLKGDK